MGNTSFEYSLDLSLFHVNSVSIPLNSESSFKYFDVPFSVKLTACRNSKIEVSESLMIL